MPQPIETSIASPAGPQRPPRALAWALLSPLLIWLCLFVVAPTAALLVYSFCRSDALGQVNFSFTLDNYRRIFAPSDDFEEPLTPEQWSRMSLRERWDEFLNRRAYLRIALRSVVYAAATTVICVLMGYPAAYFIGRSVPGWRNCFLILVMIPFWTGFLIRIYAWITILKDQGLINTLLLRAHAIQEPLVLLYTPLAVMIGLVYTFLPFMILPIYGSVEKLDESLIEAAMDLGANPLRTFGRVILPLTWPGVKAGVLLVFVPALGLFALDDLLGGGKAMMIGKSIQDQVNGQALDKPFGAALGMTLVILFCLAYWFSLRKAPVS